MNTVKDLVRFLKKKKVDFSESSLSIRKRLRKSKFRFLGQGCYKSAYVHKKFPEFVVKVNKYTGWDRDCLGVMKLPKKLRKFYLRPAFQKGRIVIQRRCDTKNGNSVKAEIQIQKNFRYDIGRYDVSDYNTGFVGDKPVFFDFCL